MTHPVPLAALDADIAIVAKKGRGKTYTAKGIVEILLRMKRRVLVLDPLSVWWGLKSSADGESAGFPVAVFGGPHGDMPLTAEMGRPLARIIATENLPAVLDMGMMTKAAWQRLVGDLLDELFTVNRDPLWIVLEEADVFAPQQPREGDSTRVLGEVDRIARRGRAFGFRLISITQRPAKLNKDVLTQLSTLIALGITSPQDRDAIKAWVDGNANRDEAATVVGSLSELDVGEGWVWAPDHKLLERVRFPAIATLDTSATPRAGESRIEPKTLAEVDLSAVRDALGAEKDAPKVKPLRNAGGRGPAHQDESEFAQAIEAAKANAYERGFKRGREEGFKEGRSLGGRQMAHRQMVRVVEALSSAAMINGDNDALEAAAKRMNEVVIEGEGPTTATAEDTQWPADVQSKPADEPLAPNKLPEPVSEPPEDDISDGAVAMLKTLTECWPLPISAVLWGAFSERSPVSGHWHKTVGELRARGLVETAGGKFFATHNGIRLAGSAPGNINSEVELWLRWRERIRTLIGSAATEMLVALCTHRPNALTGRQWGLLTNRSPVSGHWHAAIKLLTKWDCIVFGGSRYRITDKGVQIAMTSGGADTRAALREIRVGRLSSVAREIFDVLPGERAALAKRLGKSPISGSWHAAIKELLASGLAAEADKVLSTIEEELTS